MVIGMAVAKSFRELNVYRLSRAAAGKVFVPTKTFPREERFSLIDQIRRSSRAINAMSAEAWARRRYEAAFINKTDEALGECMETQAWLDQALDCGYMGRAEFAALDADYGSVGAMLSRMIDRAGDFCKHPPSTDYRVMVDEPPITIH